MILITTAGKVGFAAAPELVELPEHLAEDNVRTISMMADGDCDYLTEDVSTILCRAVGSFEQFVIDHVKAFS